MSELSRYIAANRKPPEADKAKPARVSRAKSKQRQDREYRDQEYNRIGDIVKEQNPECYYCDEPFEPEALQNDHIAGGGSRGASLLDFETINNTCQVCHDKSIPAWKKAAVKLAHTIRSIMERRGKAFTAKEDFHILAAVENALMEGPRR